MKRLLYLGTLAVFAMAGTALLTAESAKSFYNKGKDAEARQNFELAYDFYKQAYDKDPKDLRYRASYERMRFLAGASHVHRGQLLREAGKLQEALAEFQKAAEIDSSSFIAQQELKRTQEMIQQANGSSAPRSMVPAASELQKRAELARGPVMLAPISNVPITLKLTEDTKVIYETVGKLAGINVLFDPDYTSRRIKIELNGVTLEEALEIIAMESKTFWRPVTPNTIFVAQDNPNKRKEIEQSVVKTFYMTNLSQPPEIQDVVNALRQILEIQKIQQLQSQGAIIVRGTPDQIALAEKLVGDLDRARPEVVVDIAIMQVSKDKAYTVGISPPTNASIALQNNLNTSTTSTTTTTSTGSATGGTPNQINLNSLASLNATDFVVTIPAANLSALVSDSHTKIIQSPQIRSVDGQKASLKIGERLPVATGSFQPGIGGVGINPLVNTQFQYLDVGVNVDITPRVHANREVSLKVTMDVSSQTGTSSIGGINQPIIGQRKIEHEINLKEGEVSLLGGMLEDQQTKSLSGIPGLASIPLLKYLFSQTQTDHSENEIVFALIPHIVRGVDLTELNQRELEVGTGSAISLHTMSKPPAPSSPAADAPTPAAPQSATPAAQVPPASFAFDPANITQPAGSTFAVNITLTGGQNVYSVPLQISYDPKVLQMANVSNGGFLSQDGQAVALVHRVDEQTGTIQVTATRPPGANGISGAGVVITLTFVAKASGHSTLAITRGGASDPSMQRMPVTGATASVTVQ